MNAQIYTLSVFIQCLIIIGINAIFFPGLEYTCMLTDSFAGVSVNDTRTNMASLDSFTNLFGFN